MRGNVGLAGTAAFLAVCAVPGVAVAQGEAPPPLSLGTVVSLVLAGGAVGGLAAGLSRVRLEQVGFHFDDAIPATIRRWAGALVIPLFVGMAGAVAVQFALILVATDARFTDTTVNLLFHLSISTAAGFGARTLLPLLSATVEKQVATIDDRTRAIDRTTQEMSGLVDEIREQARSQRARAIADPIIEGFQRGGPIDSNDVAEALADLDVLIERDPDDHFADYAVITILILNGETERAKERAGRFLDKGRRTNLLRRHPNRYYDVMLNLACIHARDFAAGHNESLGTCLSELKEIVLNYPRLADTIRSDEDLAIIRDQPAYKEVEALLPPSGVQQRPA